jgi:cellulose synthase/poly-beta-1,6-N-acetylglucosamine synthase-like glycosyltransferase
MSHSTAAVLLFATPSTMDRVWTQLFDDTFAGIHQPALFDYALMVPYFTLLAILSIFGLHRFEILWRYYRNRHKLGQPPKSYFTELPRVTIQLPVYNEQYVIDQLVEAVSKIEYPRHLLQIQVLDDSTDETTAVCARVVSRYRAMGLPIELHHRDNRYGYKAGALEEGLKTATGEFVAIFDADFIPPTDFLMRTIHHFTDPKVGVVQTRWGYTNRDFNLLTEVQAMLLDGHFVLEHGARYAHGDYFNFNGTAGVLRVSMIRDAGGWQHDTLTEDSDLSYRAQMKGWRFVYLPNVVCPSELPVEMYSFQTQQFRWAKGLTQVACKLLPDLFRSNASWHVKVQAALHLIPNVSYPMMIGISALILPVMIVRFYMGWFEFLLLDVPVMTACFLSLIAFYCAAQRELHPRTWKRSILFIPALMAVGVGLTFINTKAFLEAIFGVKSSFVRTAKYAIAGKVKVTEKARRYKRPSGLLPWLEIAAGSYFVGTLVWAVDSFQFLCIPFLTLFVGGYYWAGFVTLYEEYRGQWRSAPKALPMETIKAQD